MESHRSRRLGLGPAVLFRQECRQHYACSAVQRAISHFAASPEEPGLGRKHLGSEQKRNGLIPSRHLKFQAITKYHIDGFPYPAGRTFYGT